ncbi:MAG: hypothetical protein R3B40_07975 [Polyangiales bacterium]|nr:hypothetical protein [Myxococcales bacterium]MCB9660688.1 hypothetical protein [Sandaracinaceae bacterium]
MGTPEADLSGVLRRLRSRADDPLPEGPPPNPAATLASALDVPRAIALSDLLSSRPTQAVPGRLDGPYSEPGAAVVAEVARQLAQVRARLMSALARPRPAALADPVLLQGVLRGHGLLGRSIDARTATDRAALQAAAAELGAPMRDHFHQKVSFMRREVAWLRQDLAANVRMLGPAAAALAALDGPLEAAMSLAITARVDDTLKQLDRAFVGGLRVALGKLPSATDDSPDLSRWLWPGGWLRGHLEDLRRLALSLYELEAAGLRALVDSAARCPTETPT